MSKEGKDKVRNLRKRSSEAKARSANAVSSNVPEEEHQDDAGNQFGRNSHTKRGKD